MEVPLVGRQVHSTTPELLEKQQLRWWLGCWNHGIWCKKGKGKNLQPVGYFYSIQLWNRLRAFSGFSHLQVPTMLKIVYLHSEAAWWEQRRGGDPFQEPTVVPHPSLLPCHYLAQRSCGQCWRSITELVVEGIKVQWVVSWNETKVRNADLCCCNAATELALAL